MLSGPAVATPTNIIITLPFIKLATAAAARPSPSAAPAFAVLRHATPYHAPPVTCLSSATLVAAAAAAPPMLPAWCIVARALLNNSKLADSDSGTGTDTITIVHDPLVGMPPALELVLVNMPPSLANALLPRARGVAHVYMATGTAALPTCHADFVDALGTHPCPPLAMGLPTYSVWTHVAPGTAITGPTHSALVCPFSQAIYAFNDHDALIPHHRASTGDFIANFATHVRTMLNPCVAALLPHVARTWSLALRAWADNARPALAVLLNPALNAAAVATAVTAMNAYRAHALRAVPVAEAVLVALIADFRDAALACTHAPSPATAALVDTVVYHNIVTMCRPGTPLTTVLAAATAAAPTRASVGVALASAAAVVEMSFAVRPATLTWWSLLHKYLSTAPSP